MTIATSRPTAPDADDLVPPADRLHRLTSDQRRRMADAGIGGGDEADRVGADRYRAMVEAGILTRSDRVELLEGWLVATMPSKPTHSLATGLLQDELTRLLPDGWHLAVQEPLSTRESEPEPDLMVVRGRRRASTGRHPGPGDVALVVEVADSTLAYDRTAKRRIYAEASIPTYWVVELVHRRLEVHTGPSGRADLPAYGRVDLVTEGSDVPLILDEHEVGRLSVRDVLP